MREKSSSVLTSLSRRTLLRCATAASARASSASSAAGLSNSSSSGLIISVSGVRNSWLTLEKNAVLARSSSASASARRRCVLKCLRLDEARRDMLGRKAEKRAIARIQDAAGIDADDEKARQPLLTRSGQRQHEGTIDHVRPKGAAKYPDAARKVLHVRGLLRSHDLGERPRLASPAVRQRVRRRERRMVVGQPRAGNRRAVRPPSSRT